MKKPANLLYGLREYPPLSVVLLNGLQHAGVIAINLIYPILVFRSSGAGGELITNLVAVGFCILGLATFLQALPRGPIGSGYMCPATFTATYLAPSVLAAKTGGLSLVFGMTIYAGVLEAALARALHRLRALVPVELSGLVIVLIGVTVSLVAVRTFIANAAAVPSAEEWTVSAITLASTIVLNIWGKGLARMLCALIGIVCGYLAALFFGVLPAADLAILEHADWISLPRPSQVGWSFDMGLVAAFSIASLAAALKAVGTINVCQRTNDAEWVRPLGRSIERGVLADGLGTALAGLLGGAGINTSTPSAGLVSATGVASRVVAYAAGAIFLVVGLTPKLAAVLAVMPRAVMAAALLFAATFIIISGLQVISSRLLDSRRTLVIGLGLIAGLVVEAIPAATAMRANWLAPIIGSSLVFGTLVAFLLNLLFRLGIRRAVSLSIDPSDYDPAEIERFFRKQGGMWGARPDVINRAVFGVTQLIETVLEQSRSPGVLKLEAGFDEFNLDLSLRYTGAVLEFPSARPSIAEIQESEQGVSRLAGFLLRRNADRVRSEQDGSSALIRFHFDH
jgi:xanthine permease XanP